MEKSEVQHLVLNCLEEYLESQDINIEVNNNTPLLGKNAVLDSMGLVNVIIDIESTFIDEGIEISLASEGAMSRKTSPFRTVATLIDFIVESLGEENE